MKWLANIRRMKFLLCDLMLGPLVNITVGFVENSDSNSAPLIEHGVFGDISLSIVGKNYNDPNVSVAKQQLLIIGKQGYPLMVVNNEPSGDVNELTLTDLSTGNLIASGLFKEDKMVKFRVLKESKIGTFAVFLLSYDQERTKWSEGFYGGTPTWTSKLESFVDIDFDGHMDAKGVLDPNTHKFLSNSIYIDGVWQKVDWVGYQDRKASLKVGNEKIRYEFKDGKGWEESQDSNRGLN